MVIGVCTIRLHLPASGSLKTKRGVLKSLIARVRHEYNVSMAEVGDNDLWQSAVLGVAAVSNDPDYVQGMLSRVVQWIEENRFDVTVVDYEMEIVR